MQIDTQRMRQEAEIELQAARATYTHTIRMIEEIERRFSPTRKRRLLKELGPEIVVIKPDTTDVEATARAIATVVEKFGNLDVVFANAGIAELSPLGQITEAHFDKTFDINVKGTLFTVQKALPLMPNGASIVINASVASFKGLPAFGVYAATKAALRSFARSWSVDLKDRKIRVNVISPGMVITPIWNGLGSDKQIDEMKSQFSGITPLGRPGTPDEIAKAVEFLASNDSSYVTGIELSVDGGWAQI